MRYRIEHYNQYQRDQFFLDYEVEKNCWKNIGVYSTYEKALQAKVKHFLEGNYAS
jgi:hypothetical protein